jgi:hypothetical protein
MPLMETSTGSPKRIMAKLCTPAELRKLTGTKIPAEQVAVLRRRGLNPFVCPRTGCPIIYESVIRESMLGNQDNQSTEWRPNLEVFK